LGRYDKLLSHRSSLLTLPLILYGCETWFLILKAKHKKLQVSENQVFRKISEPTKAEAIE
jgi:hypothetical protein